MGEISTNGPKALRWVLDRAELPPGHHVEVFDGYRSIWALEPDGDPLANAVTDFASLFAGTYPASRELRARAHGPSGAIVEELRFLFDGGPCWAEA
jgi:hypothetical protein